MEFNTMSIDPEHENKEQLREDQILECVIDDNQEPTQFVMPFDVEIFYSFIRGDMNNENVGQMLQPMYESMGTKFEKKKTWGSRIRLKNVKLLNQRCFKATNETIEKLPNKNTLGRDYIYKTEDIFYHVLSVFKKSYGKWQYKHHTNEGYSVMAHVQQLEICFNSYQPTPTPKYFWVKLTRTFYEMMS